MFIIFVGNSDDGYKEYAKLWSSVGCKLVTEPIPADEQRKWVGETVMDAYGVYEGNGIVEFISTTNGEIFKCYANSAIVPLVNLISRNISFDDYVAEYTGYDDEDDDEGDDEDDNGRDIVQVPLNFSAYVEGVLGELSKWDNAF